MKKFLSKENFSTSWNYLMSLLSKKQDRLPNGEAGQILTKTEEGFEWQTPQVVEERPENLLLDSYRLPYNSPITIQLANQLKVKKGDQFVLTHFSGGRVTVVEPGKVAVRLCSNDYGVLGSSDNYDFGDVITIDPHPSGDTIIPLTIPLDYIEIEFLGDIARVPLSYILVKGNKAPTEWYPNPADYLTKAKLFNSYIDRYGAEQDQTFGEFLHAMKLPDDGSEGQVLTKTETGVEWKDIEAGSNVEPEYLNAYEIEDMFNSIMND